MYRPHKDDPELGGGLVLTSQEAELLREILHYLTDMVGVSPKLQALIPAAIVSMAHKLSEASVLTQGVYPKKRKKSGPKSK